jgi:predicted kinase
VSELRVARTVSPFASERPLLIILGGFGGAGKTTLSRRLSTELGIPRLGSDDLIRIVGRSRVLADRASDVPWIAYDIFFGLAEDFLRTGLSVILDSNMGEAWRWQRIDAIRERQPEILILPIVLRVPIETCVERMRGRHANDPDNEIAAETIMAEPRHVRKWAFVETLDRSDIYFVDADRPKDAVYEEVRRYLLKRAGDGRVDDNRQEGPL